MQKSAVIYARVSTDEQAEKGFSIASQLEACRALAQRHGLTVAAEFTDPGVSGSLLERPGLDALRECVRRKQADHVLVYDSDRLSRDMLVKLLVLDDVEKQGAAVLYVSETYDATPEGRLFANIRGCISQFEREKFRERSQRGKRQKAREGRMPITSAPFGYRVVTKQEVTQGAALPGTDGQVVVVEENADVVRTIFHGYAVEGRSLRQIGHALTDAGVASPRGAAWCASTVRGLLTNTAYVGRILYNTRQAKPTSETRNGKRVVKREARDESQWITVPCPPLVTEDVFRRTQERLARNRQTYSGNPRNAYLLTGMARCPECGRRLNGASPRVGKARKPYPHYWCQYAHRAANAGHTCTYTRYHATSIVDGAVHAAMRHVLTNPAFVLELLADAAQKAGEQEEARRSERERQGAALRECQEAERRLLKAFSAGFSAEAVEEELGGVRKKRQAAEGRLRELDAPTAETPGLPTPGEVEEACRLIGEEWDRDMDVRDRRQLLSRVVEWVEPLPKGARAKLRPLDFLLDEGGGPLLAPSTVATVSFDHQCLYTARKSESPHGSSSRGLYTYSSTFSRGTRTAPPCGVHPVTPVTFRKSSTSKPTCFGGFALIADGTNLPAHGPRSSTRHTTSATENPR